MTSEFTPEETREFIRLLKKIQENGYWTPSGTWQETLRTFARYACELVVIDLSQKSPRILLTRYTGNTMPSHQHHFHIPGGFARVNESIEETCTRVAKDELGANVKLKEILGVHKWTAEEGEAGIRPLSLYTLCEQMEQIPLHDDRRFFTHAEMMELDEADIVSFHPHRSFANTYLRNLES
jgi:ADP-ribose pyrophosphatase YjhB (NUDIX family)